MLSISQPRCWRIGPTTECFRKWLYGPRQLTNSISCNLISGPANANFGSLHEKMYPDSLNHSRYHLKKTHLLRQSRDSSTQSRPVRTTGYTPMTVIYIKKVNFTLG